MFPKSYKEFTETYGQFREGLRVLAIAEAEAHDWRHQPYPPGSRGGYARLHERMAMLLALVSFHQKPARRAAAVAAQDGNADEAIALTSLASKLEEIRVRAEEVQRWCRLWFEDHLEDVP